MHSYYIATTFADFVEIKTLPNSSVFYKTIIFLIMRLPLQKIMK